MSGYFGAEAQQRLQMQAEVSVDLINATPGAWQTSRTMGSAEPDRFGWESMPSLFTATASAVSCSCRRIRRTRSGRAWPGRTTASIHRTYSSPTGTPI